MSNYGISPKPGPEVPARHINRLPCLASGYRFENEEPHGWNQAFKTILEGTRDSGSPLHALRGLESSLVRRIYEFANLGGGWADHVTLTIPATCVSYLRDNHGWRAHRTGKVAYVSCGTLRQFPDPANRNVNMMPFVFGDKSSLPSDLQCYYRLIQACPYKRKGDNMEWGRVGYLTVHEGFVKAGDAQRRKGLYIETPGVLFENSSGSFHRGEWVSVFDRCPLPDMYEGGIYVASNVKDTIEVWDALVDKNVPGIVDKQGACEHLRPFLGMGTKLAAKELIWMTDCTPHEALEQQVDGYRQFFRVVTPGISHWFAHHSTANPLVAIPDNIIVVHEDKSNTLKSAA